MSRFNGPHDNTNRGKIPKVTVPFWSKKRCWHGDQVTITVVTENIPDGTAAVLTILPKGGGTAVDTVTGLSISGAKLTHQYTIQWRDMPLPKKERAFVIKATVGKVASAQSHELLVDLEPPVFSD